MSKIKVLLAEDEASLGMIVRESLESRDFIVDHAENGEQALDLYKTNQPDILVLDVMMPKKDGFTLAKEIRESNKNIPIIFLTAKSQTSDVLEGFNLGGNDYLKKPFSMEELIVRIKALLNRIELKTNLELIKIGNYIFNFTKQTLEFENLKENLTHREAELLFHLQQNKNQVLDRTFILNKLWGNDDFFNARSMDVFISKLRKKLKKDENIQILNIRGFGYKLIC
ncbi:response regulator transcription factor [Polaribacter dokdonensis]|uniref:DNA-binding response regulator, OmpR family, contains REC and winged-helix (WHTH) domain n=1 Tax=Polaribacter dokdonensis DSW-5 TaxID=1300348 RepID=A0A0N0CEW9_9FLAO|nr:response regulator transcription factor [Polaribacter dokdonensis]KOY51054.1 Two-component system response regulator [Polaribacter dokdonensis DSW-5]SEE19732.1 DNA-binding response regulator, OmpR family, contains REC and winged-helix (wHTH) domain [Polaribacter dokdonensis DSW-5]